MIRVSILQLKAAEVLVLDLGCVSWFFLFMSLCCHNYFRILMTAKLKRQIRMFVGMTKFAVQLNPSTNVLSEKGIWPWWPVMRLQYPMSWRSHSNLFDDSAYIDVIYGFPMVGVPVTYQDSNSSTGRHTICPIIYPALSNVTYLTLTYRFSIQDTAKKGFSVTEPRGASVLLVMNYVYYQNRTCCYKRPCRYLNQWASVKVNLHC